MTKVAILVPYKDMCDLAQSVVYQYKNINPLWIEYTKTDEIVERAQALANEGCELIIARGTQASSVKKTIRLPLVEMRVTAQELGCIVLQLRKEIGNPTPKIAIVGFENMISDTSRFNELFDVELKKYMVQSPLQLPAAVQQALNDGCQGVIGGEIVCQEAARLNVRHLFIQSGLESIHDALRTASDMCYAIEIEKHNTAEIDAMLNYTSNGIMQVNSSGIVLRVNRVGYDLLEQTDVQLIGKHVTEVLPNLNKKILEDALFYGKETYAFALDIRRKMVMMNLAPIKIDSLNTGAILTFHEGDKIMEMSSELRRELYQQGFIAHHKFEDFTYESKDSKAVTDQAKQIAKFPAPVLLMGESGCGKSILAQCIHNESLVNNNAFVTLDCSVWSNEILDTMLFGNYATRKETNSCMAELAQGGTLYLRNIEKLSFETQYKVLNLIRGKLLHNGSNQPIEAKVRVIASTHTNLFAVAEKGEFRSDLYYALTVLKIEPLPLRRRKEEIVYWADYYLAKWQERYKKYIRLTQDAKQFIQGYDWPGNLYQMDSVCERIIILTKKRDIDAMFFRKQVEQVVPKLLQGTEKIVLYKDEKAANIAQLLRQNQGNRDKVSAELGVSKTTLWRYMKKYGIEQDYSY